MKSFLIVCYVNLHDKKTSNASQVAEIGKMLSNADIVDYDFTFLLKSDIEHHSLLNYAHEFLNDPLGIIEAEKSFDENEEYEEYNDEDNKDEIKFSYNDYNPLFLYFVSSHEIYKKFKRERQYLNVEEGNSLSLYYYEISMLDQMEILIQLQTQENDRNMIEKCITTKRPKRFDQYFKRIQN